MVWGLFPVDPLSGEDKYYIFRCGIYKVGRKALPNFYSFMFIIGGGITNAIGQECTHVLVDQNTPLKNDLVDAVVARKPFILKTWVEFVAEKSISTEIPSYNSSYIPTLSVEGASVRVVDPKAREHCLKGYTFLLDSVRLNKFGGKLKSLLEVAGAKIASFEEFCSDSQGLDYGEDNRVVCIIPGGPASNSDRFNKQSSLPRVNEIDIISAALSGQLDLSILISPCVLVSSSCSTDETIVADSDTEVETATSARASETLCRGDDIKCEKGEIPLDDAPARSSNMKFVRTETSLDGVSARLSEKGDIKTEHRESALHDASQPTSFREGGCGMIVKKDEVDDSGSRHSDIIYSQDLIVRDIDLSSGTNAASISSLPNFKRFRKMHTQSGNSFSNLVPFAKYPYKDSDCENEEINKSVKEEKKRKQMEAIAEDLFNNQKARKRGTAGSLRGILIS
ncbi:nibrin homolog [Prosopis cineraria]|uniref:nibrin homolog n=1 Tax=Prosopis cineraria TaxID=364024 RepID=UPI0024105BA5|nr:nibrin homolog [Prosopis cineraria]